MPLSRRFSSWRLSSHLHRRVVAVLPTQAGVASASRHQYLLGSYRFTALGASTALPLFTTPLQQQQQQHRRLFTSTDHDVLLQRWQKRQRRLISNSGVQCVMDLLRRRFVVERTYEMAHADLAVRPFGVGEDLWLPVQVKTCGEKTNYGFWFFNGVHQYPGMAVVCVALSDFRIWCYSGSILQQRGGCGKLTVCENGKWDHESFRCSTELDGPASLSHKLLLAYQDRFFIKDSLTNVTKRRTETSRKGEASIAAWAPLLYAAGVEVRQELIYESTPVDSVWRWNGKKFLIQHKLAPLHSGNNNGSYCVVLRKGAGKKEGRRIFQLYDGDDFDLLAVSLPGDRYFNLIAMEAPVHRGVVNGHGERRQCTSATVMLWTPEAEAMQRVREEKRGRGGRADFWANEYLIDTHADDGGVGRLHAILEGAKCST
ncbi:unnamed protein product [Vitrella brassicaformis CCMP3155]|uniref:Uncharacterized protein n=1 Tax=Vitrella brassicaformis (strain CCMP3155) TaxID=1169540 RepID=A0A0G4G9I4_VITBC|nr:unnamed protein product [Vitrella brassicaformis CCMP3155]|eukprot:CEM25458.1 unnamed protein product [Vitrella brassicaformis CCMP3155]